MFYDIYHILSVYFNWYFRPLIKWFLRKTTHLCELQRICYGDKMGALRTLNIENSLKLSRNPQIIQLVHILGKVHKEQNISRRDYVYHSVFTVLNVKKINSKIHPQFVTSFSRCIEQLHAYETLKRHVESLRTESYDATNPKHEEKLLRLWKNLMPDVELTSRVTKQWQDIGFQGDDPKTDFRGMGLLGLENLIFFATEYRSASARVLQHSLHPQYGYAFAVVGINITSMAYGLLKDGAAKTHIFNIPHSLPNLRLFHQLYSYLFYEFDKFWIDEKPRDVMEFASIRDRFENNIRQLLSNYDTTLKVNLPIDTI